MNPVPVSLVDCQTRDRLTELPDHIRLHILTFLTIKDAIHTSLLSQSWINLWSHLSTLVFHLDSNLLGQLCVTDEDLVNIRKAAKKFTCFVDRALLSLNSQCLDKFCFSFDFTEYRYQKLLCSWLRFAVNRNVRHIGLVSDVCDNREDIDTFCDIPSFLWQCDVLISLNLKKFEISTCAPEIKCKSLQSLSLDFCFLDQSFFAKLLLGCPALETLELVDCNIENSCDLTIYHEGLKELVIRGVCCGDEMIIISAPNLSLLVLSGVADLKCQSSNMSSLEEAFIDLDCSGLFVPLGLAVIDILARMTNVRKLTFGSQCIEALSLLHLLDTIHAPFPISSCRTLVLHTYPNEGIAWLLHSCPQLETFTISIWPSRPSSSWIDNARPSFWESELGDGYFSFLDHLKNVNVIGLAPHHPETKYVTEFLQFILKHGKVLKTLSIKAKRNNESMSDDHSCLNTQFELAQTLLSFPRLSREAAIHLTVL